MEKLPPAACLIAPPHTPRFRSATAVRQARSRLRGYSVQSVRLPLLASQPLVEPVVLAVALVSVVAQLAAVLVLPALACVQLLLAYVVATSLVVLAAVAAALQSAQ